jgi:cyanophycin synthetase
MKALRGPNLWSRFTAVETLVTCEATERALPADHPLIAQLRLALPGLGALPYWFDGQRKHTAASLIARPASTEITVAHLLAAATLEMQKAAGCPVEFCETTLTDDGQHHVVVVQYTEEKVGRMAMEHAQALLQALLANEQYDISGIIAQMQDIDEDIRLGPSTGSIVNAAIRHDIPYRRLTEGSMVQFGYGSRQQRILAAESSMTSAIAESIAQDKELTKELLHAAGVPVPQGRTVNDADDAWAAAQEIGVPVAVKPRDGNQGKGISVNLKTEAQVRAAYDLAYEISYEVMVERYLPGADFRLLVVGDKLIAAARRDPAHVIGNGKDNIGQLIDEVNRDPRRSDGHATSLTKIRLDEIAMATLTKQGLSASSVPAAGVKVVLRNNANLSTGGTATDVTDDVHPDIAIAAVNAVQMVGLDIAGVDLVCEYIDRPLLEQGGGIVEVNAAPGLRMHLDPSYGPARDVGEAIISNMFPRQADGRIPIITVTGTNGKTTTARLSAHLMAQTGLRMGWTCSDGVYALGKRIDTGDCSGPKSARNLLAHPHVDGAVLETARGGILREGLGFDRSDVTIVTNIGMGDHLGMNNINTVEGLACVKRVLVENVKSSGLAILNAEDPHTVNMAPHCPGEVIFFASHASHPLIEQQRAAGKRIACRQGDDILLAEGRNELRFPLRDIPLTRNGSITFQVENAMCAAAAAWALGIPAQAIGQGLATFVSDVDSAPGRFNVFDYKGATLIADYGHNPDAIIALVKAVQAMPGKHRSAVISGAGDRRDVDISMQTQILGDAFDDIILYEDACNRGRTEGEVVNLLRQGLQGASRVKSVSEIKGEFIAIDSALAKLAPGDLCLILVDQVDEALAHIAARCQQASK